uniref:ABC transmembrane type-1 domain-containing protein n=1 Tax=Acrobeloides nanus TaxID=290746 RepID=A0A914D011_9BILA
MNAKSVLMNIIFDKMLKLSPAARAKTSAGEFVNMVTTDVNRIRFFWFRLNEFIYSPLNIGFCFILLFIVLGHCAWYGVLTVFLFVPLNAYAAELQSKFEEKQMEFKDARLKLMSDVLSGIKVLKLYAWEPPIQKRIAQLRERETTELRKANYIGIGLMESSFTMCPILATIACFVAYTL